jgi:hypothetical protein
MMLPAVMPSGRSLALSAVLIECGLAALVLALIAAPAYTPGGAALIVCGLGSFVVHIRLTLKRRLPRPPALPHRDWSTWQTHMALLWLLIAAVLGLVLSIGVVDEGRLPLMWMYGVAGLVGFLAQIVVGMQGRLVPLYAWYRALDARGTPPAVAANALPSASFARPIFLLWTAAVPLLAWGLAFEARLAIRTAAVLLLLALAAGLAYMRRMLRRAEHICD